ncbi:hypothetical protein C9374_013151 [Naegleria lovaniensis]|uniref:Nucleolar complex protein 2 homolog n=1 Tax=Naegleria lovaniensis TaxID=51637 RepID=A0AA88KHF0_NAELO|nr:uncharacterized protein C9374_013151 [Naegleria lovaniensis]KAG2372787.1 hypothetical protein C9374_013151 [Naegleria lovaniensis]
MGRNKQTKSDKKYKKNKKLVKAKIKTQRMTQEKKVREVIRNEKLKNEDLSDSEKEEEQLEQHYLKAVNKKKPSSTSVSKQSSENKTSSSGTISKEEIADFFEKLKAEGGKTTKEEEEEIQQLISGVDEDDEEEVYDGGEREEGDSEDHDENIPADQEDDEQDEAYFQRIADEIEEENEKQVKEFGSRIKVTKALIARWVKKIKSSNAVQPLFHLVLCFRSGLKKEASSDEKKKKKDEPEIPYVVPDAATFARVAMACVKCLGDLATILTKYEQGSNKMPAKYSGWKQVKLALSTFINAFYTLMESSVDEKLLIYILHYFTRLVPFYGLFEAHPKKILRIMLNLLGHTNEDVRVRAFLIINSMAVIYPYPFLELCIKGVYYTLLRNSKGYNPSTFQQIEFLKNCLVELASINFNSTFQHAFIYIRELSITVRRAMDTTVQNGYALCYNWKFFHCLDAWAKVVCAYFKQEKIGELLYPITQIAMAGLGLSNSAKHYPFKIKLLTMLNTLSRECDRTFIPISQFIFEILQLKQATETPKQNQKPQPLYFEFKLKAMPEELKSREFHQRIIDDCCFLLLDLLATHSKSVAFPELSYPITSFLKKYVKNHSETLHFGIAKQITNLVKHVNDNIIFVNEAKSKISFTPLEFDKANQFLQDTETPLEKYYATEKKRQDRELLERVAAKLDEKVLFEDGEDEEESALREIEETKLKRKRASTTAADEDETTQSDEKETKKKKKSTTSKTTSKQDTLKELDLENF